MFTIPTANEISLEVNGNRIGAAQSYSAKHIKDKPTYSVTLGRVCFASEINILDIPIFNVVITKPDRKIVFSGCEWACFDESGSALEMLTVVASKRLEIA